MKKILMATDGSAHAGKALALAIELARVSRVPLVVINVVMPPFAPPAPYGITTAGLESGLREYGASIASAAAEEARQAGVDARWQVETGSPPEVILRAVETTGADLVVVGTRGQGALQRALLGSVSNRLVHQSHVPVLVVPRDVGKRIRVCVSTSSNPSETLSSGNQRRTPDPRRRWRRSHCRQAD